MHFLSSEMRVNFSFAFPAVVKKNQNILFKKTTKIIPLFFRLSITNKKKFKAEATKPGCLNTVEIWAHFDLAAFHSFIVFSLQRLLDLHECTFYCCVMFHQLGMLKFTFPYFWIFLLCHL